MFQKMVVNKSCSLWQLSLVTPLQHTRAQSFKRNLTILKITLNTLQHFLCYFGLVQRCQDETQEYWPERNDGGE